MRISDWSSDVCSSDLAGQLARRKGDAERADGEVGAAHAEDDASEQQGEDDAADRGRPHAQREAIEEVAVVEHELLAAARRGVGADVGEQADLYYRRAIHAGAEEKDVAQRVVAHLPAGDVPGDGKKEYQPRAGDPWWGGREA